MAKKKKSVPARQAEGRTIQPIENNKKNKEKKLLDLDYGLFFLMIFLLAFGMVMLYSASAYTATLQKGDSTFYLKKQLLSAAIGFVGLLAVVLLGYQRTIRIFALPVYLVGLLGVFATLFMGTSINNSARWIYIGPVSVQPSEIVKVGIILLLSYIIGNYTKQMREKNFVIFVIVLTVLPTLLVMYTNLSTGIIILGIAFLMIFIANPKYRVFFGIAAGAFAFIAVFLVSGYRQERILVWQHPEDYDAGYQTLQGLYAIGSGGLFGKGLGESMQKLGFVPEAQNDMIFSIICEELGLFGGIGLIVVYILLLWRLYYVANHARTTMGSFAVIGIMIHIALQVVLNVAVVTNTIPNTGITLPFVSYGGTSLSILITEMGLALSVSADMDEEEE